MTYTLALALALAAALFGLAAIALRARRDRRRLDTLVGERVELRQTLEEARRALDEVEARARGVAEDLLNCEREAAETGHRLERLHNLLDALPQPIWRRDSSLALRFCNEAYARAVGQDRESVLARGTDLVEGDDRELALALARRALDSGNVQRERFHVVAEGQRRLVEVSEQPLPDGSLVGHVRDLTDIEALEGDLDRHVAAHRAILEQLGVGIAILGADLHLTFYNAAYVQLWGLDEAFLDGRPHLTDMLERLRENRRLPEQADFAEYKRQELRLASTLIESVEDLMHLPDGTTLRRSLHPHPFGGVIVTFEDVTDRLRLERTYNTLLEVQRETLDKLYEGVAVYGADGQLKLFNPAFARIWDLPLEFLSKGPHVRDIVERCRGAFEIEVKDWPVFVEATVARTTEPEARSGRRERADGSVIDWSQVPLPDGACLFSFVDVTDTTRVERALRERNEALETTDRLKSEFIANISYELRTPLNAIIGFAEILQNEYFGPLNKRQREYSSAIVESSQRLITLINDILDLASIEAGYLQLDRQAVDLSALLSNAQTLWRERARARGLELIVDCPVDIGVLGCDERRIAQALFNLLSNAFKFTPSGGSITLKAERRPDEVLLSVTDTGIGIPPQDQARVFGKFERAGPSGTARSRQAGAGLGLSLAKSLIELHGGWIELRSTLKQGTTAVCHLPIQPAPNEPRIDDPGDRRP